MADPMPTVETGVVAIEQGTEDDLPYTIYKDLSSLQTWKLKGICNNCGLCYIGAGVDERFQGQPGTPEAYQDALAQDRWYETMRPGFEQDMIQTAQETEGATVGGCQFEITPLDPVTLLRLQ